MSGLTRSWVESANSPSTPFPLNNLPYGVFSVGNRTPRCGVAIGEMILDLAQAESEGLLNTDNISFLNCSTWNHFMAAGEDLWLLLRGQITDILSDTAIARADLLVRQSNCKMHMPFVVAEFTDFYASKSHATNVGTMFRGAENALPRNWLHIPIGYNGRASSVVVSGTDIVRPCGQLVEPGADAPIFGPSQRLDIELELGAVIGGSNRMGSPVTVQEADDMIFGYLLLNDWSARDIQSWEYQPLGPFQAKAFATSISPWVVTKAALEQFRVSTPQREKELLSYLHEPSPMLYDIELSVEMSPSGKAATTISHTNYREMYYSSAQQIAHHASSGCPMRPGDLVGSGTVSGPGREQRGSLLELTWDGEEPLRLDTGERRTFVEDGDTLTLSGWAQGDGFRVGFGECTNSVVPADREFVGKLR
ncbi:MAG: fumarylacetoacetase [Boseongicola sp.]|nr:MAG: fumarylacetoacetase [Boseongicola sp.]